MARQRNKDDEELLIQTLSAIRISCLIAGGARGADTAAAKFAKLQGIPLEEYPITSYEWGRYGKKAGYLRNRKMIEQGKPDLVVAFPGGKGTAMMVGLAKKAGLEVIEIV